MLRSKRTRPPVVPATSPSQCPIDNLPSELLHMVCTHLKPKDVANLRLASRVVAPIGLQYLSPKVHLLIAKDSFKQLEAIAKHPVVSKYVTSLSYEANILEIYDEERWTKNIWSPDYLDRKRKLQETGRRYSLRSHKGGCTQARTVPRHEYTKRQLKEAFRKYEGFCDYQSHVQEHHRELANAMKSFPNLKELTMSAHVMPNKQLFKKTFGPGYCTRWREDTEKWPVGLAQMRSLLLSACHAGLKIERLHCEQVNWRTLTQKNEVFEDMKRSVRHLREMSITFSMGCGGEEDEWGVIQIERCLLNGRLKDFVTSAPHLELLEICFESDRSIISIEFEHLVGDFHWPSLKAVKIDMVETAEDHLVGFFERHAGTLKRLCMSSLLLSDGSWWSVFEKMRLVLELESVEILGCLDTDSDGFDFDFDRGIYVEQSLLKEGIKTYLLGGRTDHKIPLTKQIAYCIAENQDCSFDPNSDTGGGRWDLGDGDGDGDDGW